MLIQMTTKMMLQVLMPKNFMRQNVWNEEIQMLISNFAFTKRSRNWPTKTHWNRQRFAWYHKTSIHSKAFSMELEVSKLEACCLNPKMSFSISLPILFDHFTKTFFQVTSRNHTLSNLPLSITPKWTWLLNYKINQGGERYTLGSGFSIGAKSKKKRQSFLSRQ